MGTSEFDLPGSWVPQACTLPTAERPVRVAEFDRLFTDAVRTADRLSATRLALELDPTPEVAAQTAGLVTRETACCSFSPSLWWRLAVRCDWRCRCPTPTLM